MPDPYGRDIPSAVPLPTGQQGVDMTRGYPWPGGLRPIPDRNIEGALQEYVDHSTPRLRRLLVNTWNAQADALTYEEIIHAFETGELSGPTLRRFQESYTELVNGPLTNQWIAAYGVGWRRLLTGLRQMAGGRVELSSFSALMRDWTTARAAELAVNFTEAQTKAVRNMVTYFTSVNPIHPRQFARFLRPVVGLTDRQWRSTALFREQLIEDGLSRSQVDGRVAEYAARQNRIRADRIARTETAYAWNFGQFHSLEQASKDGLVTQVRKRFLTAQDERVCAVCGGLGGWRQEGETLQFDEDGQAIIGLEETFPTSGGSSQYVPPVHPNCRCTVIYETDDVAVPEETEDQGYQTEAEARLGLESDYGIGWDQQDKRKYGPDAYVGIANHVSSTFSDLRSRFGLADRPGDAYQQAIGRRFVLEQNATQSPGMYGSALAPYKIENFPGYISPSMRIRQVPPSDIEAMWRDTWFSAHRIPEELRTPDEMMRAVVRHETGHMLTTSEIADEFDALIASRWDGDWFRRNISEYAGTSRIEAIAEMFQVYTAPGYEFGALPVDMEILCEKMLEAMR